MGRPWKRIALVFALFFPHITLANVACFDWTDRFGVPARICAPVNDAHDAQAVQNVYDHQAEQDYERWQRYLRRLRRQQQQQQFVGGSNPCRPGMPLGEDLACLIQYVSGFNSGSGPGSNGNNFFGGNGLGLDGFTGFGLGNGSGGNYNGGEGGSYIHNMPLGE